MKNAPKMIIRKSTGLAARTTCKKKQKLILCETQVLKNICGRKLSRSLSNNVKNM